MHYIPVISTQATKGKHNFCQVLESYQKCKTCMMWNNMTSKYILLKELRLSWKLPIEEKLFKWNQSIIVNKVVYFRVKQSNPWTYMLELVHRPFCKLWWLLTTWLFPQNMIGRVSFVTWSKNGGRYGIEPTISFLNQSHFKSQNI